MTKLTLAFFAIALGTLNARANESQSRTDEEVIAILRARIAREEQTDEGAKLWHGAVVSTEVIEKDDCIFKRETYEDAFQRVTKSTKTNPKTTDEWARLIRARREAMKRSLNKLGPGAPRSFVKAQEKAINDLDRVITNTVITTIGCGENGAN